MNWKLNENSEVLGQPSELKIPLRRHQLAMLYRCLFIEKNAYKSKFPYGIIADKAGSGKTAVIISLILADKILYGRTQNLIVVPQNIYSQWIKEFNKFTGDVIKVTSFINYSDISNLYMSSDILYNSDVLITTVLYYDLIISMIDQTGNDVRRIIFDEIDSLSNVIEQLDEKKKIILRSKQKALELENNHGIKPLIPIEQDIGSRNKNIWFISASFDNSIKDDGFRYKNKFVPLNDLPNIMCKCEDDFIDKYNFELPKPIISTVYCDDISDDYFDYLSVQQLDNMNSLSYQNIGSNVSNSNEAIKYIIDGYWSEYNKLINNLDKIKSNVKMINNELNSLENSDNNLSGKKQYEIIFNAKKMMTEDLISTEKNIIFHLKIIESFHDLKCKNNCSFSSKYTCILDKLNSINYNNTKLKNIEQFLTSINKSKDKILIFSDNIGGFKVISQLLDKYNIKYTEICGGNINIIDKSIDMYKNKDTNVLLIDSSSHGCGMNLENTTHLIFIHKTSEILNNQIIGRAQRPIRTDSLKIITYLNMNEKVD